MKIPAPVCPARRAREGAPAAPFWSVDEAGPDERSLAPRITLRRPGSLDRNRGHYEDLPRMQGASSRKADGVLGIVPRGCQSPTSG
jgi:hypothetical protein